MANEKTDDKVLVNIGDAANKLTTFFEKNSKVIYYTVGIIAVLVIGYFGVKYLYIEPKAKEATAEMFYAQRYFEADSLNTALNGDGQHLGFIDIIDGPGSDYARCERYRRRIETRCGYYFFACGFGQIDIYAPGCGRTH